MHVFNEIRKRLSEASKTMMPVIPTNEALVIVNQVEAEYNNGWIVFKTRELTEEEKELFTDTECETMLDCKLPEDGEEILVTYSNGCVDVDTFMKDGYECYLDSGNDIGTEAIAWQYKPKSFTFVS